jgi:negative regulator of flagellin synthesis FlgM
MEIPGNNYRVKGKTIQERMKVEDKTPSTKSQGGTSSTGSTELIAISSKAKDIQKANEVVNAAADIRIEKVDQIKERIAKGNYSVTSEHIAEKMLENIITESKFLG